MNKYSGAQVGQMMKLAAENVRALSTENQGLRNENTDLMTKVAQYEKRGLAEKIAASMEEKGLEPETTLDAKIENLLTGERDLSVLEQAVEMTASQMKTASVVEGNMVPVEGDTDGNMAATQFAANLASLS